MPNIRQSLGPVSAWAIAKKHGFTGTEEEWERLQAEAPQYGQQAADAARQAGLDAQATAADRQATGLDAAATAADREATGADKTATNADREATAADAQATAADREAVAGDRGAAQTAAQTATQQADRAEAQVTAAAGEVTKAAQQADRAKSEADKAAGAVEAGLTDVRADIRELSATKADKESAFELIDTITLSEPTVIDLSAEPDGTPYDFDAIMVNIDYKGAETVDGFNFPIYSDTDTICQPYVGTFNGEGHAYFLVFQDHGIWRSVYTSVVAVDYSTPTIYTDSPFFAGKWFVKEHPCIRRIGTYVPLPKGFSLTIKAVRRK